MFMLFFACLSAISPPVAPAAFAAGAIAGANPFTIGNLACKYAVGGFLLPFMFVFNNGMLLQGAPERIALDIALGVALVFIAAVATHGFVLRTRLPLLLRLMFAALTLAIMWPALEIQGPAALSAVALYLALYAVARRKEASGA